MNLTDLRYFIAVVEGGSFSRASSRLGISQPSLSRQIRKLEEEFKSALFYRNGRGVSLTEAGDKLYRAAVSSIGTLDSVAQELIRGSEDATGHVTLGASNTIATMICGPVAKRFHEEFPLIRLRIREGFSSTVFDWLEEGFVDVGLIYDTRHAKTLNTSVLMYEDLYLLQPAGNTDSSDITLEEVARLPLVLPGPDDALRRLVERAAKRAGYVLNIVMEVDSVPAMRQLSARGIGCAILPFASVAREVRRGRLTVRRVDDRDMRAPLAAATPLNREISPAASKLLSILGAEIRRLMSTGDLRGSVDQFD